MKENILIVDDSPEILGVLSAILEGAGYRVCLAENGRNALASLRTESIDLIVLDIVMPGMDGYEVCQALKGDPASRDIPVIFISGLDDPLDKALAFEAGGVDYVAKPFNQPEVLARVRTHLRVVQLRRRLEQHNEELDRVVEERTAALRAINAGLEKALQARQDFLSLVSHELRTPLNGILGMASLLEIAVDPSQQKYVDVIKASGWSLVRRIDDILLMVGQGGEKETPWGASEEIGDVAGLCEGCLRRILPLADKKGVSAQFEVSRVIADGLVIPRSRLSHILGNLLDNAVRFTPNGGRIGLQAYRSQEQKRLFLDVWDTGTGIPDADKARVFEPFVQLEPVLTRRHGGLGLGLTLAKRLTELHGGTVELADRPGGGSLFRVSLPLQ